ncbi:MAG: transcriptional repressor [Clostridiales bacterium]|nr:transcriptional repressor [Clostridiales bacterium]
MGNKKNLLNEKLKEKGLKFTNQRKDIYDFFLKNQDKHMSAEEILSEIEKGNSEIGLATIYRTLQLFTDTGIIVKHDFDDGRSRYELKTDNDVHNHHHLICQVCGKIIEVNMDLMDELEKEIEDEYDFEITNHIVKLYGHCKDCKK